MNSQIAFTISQLQETYNGQPWFGRSIKSLLNEVSIEIALQKPNPQSHSIAELVYHIVTWKEFAITRLQPQTSKDIHYFDKMDWRELDLSNPTTWFSGLQLLEESQEQLITSLHQTDDSILEKIVPDRKYDYRFLLNGLLQHDIYHTGQIAYVKKLLADR